MMGFLYLKQRFGSIASLHQSFVIHSLPCAAIPSSMDFKNVDLNVSLIKAFCTGVILKKTRTAHGIYRIESLNPNSMFHLSQRANFPNAFDRKKAETDGRNDPAGDIMIYGNTCSIGCLAMGDAAIEELFAMDAQTGYHNISVMSAPVDFRCAATINPAEACRNGRENYMKP